MPYCRETIAVKHEGHISTANTLKCNCWGCDVCEPKRKKQLIAESMGGAPCTFLTLTYRANDQETPEQAAPKLSRAWRLLRLRILRKYHWRKLPFLAVMEKTKQGWPHLHIMLRTRYIDWKYISDVMAELINSPVIRIEKITNKSRAAGYVSKYCGKAAQKFRKTKRYWQSPDYDLREKKKDDDEKSFLDQWQRLNTHILVWAQGQEDFGRRLQWFGYDQCVSFDPLESG